MRFVAGRGAVAERHRENVASQGAVAEKLTPNEVCCWQGSPLGGPSGKQNEKAKRESKIGKIIGKQERRLFQKIAAI